MKKLVGSLGFLVLMGFSTFSNAAVEVTELDNAEPIAESKTATDGLTLRGLRRAGIGFVGGGVAGIAGLELEINFLDNLGLIGGGGISTDYRSFYFGGKYVWGGTWFLPYTSAGFVQWSSYGQGESVGQTTPGFLGEKFLSRDELRTGAFAENMLFASLGLQYLQLKGDWAGFAPSLGAVLLWDIDQFRAAVTGQFGISYFF